MTPSTGQPHTRNLEESADVLLAVLDARSRDIVTRRHGLRTDSVETLDSIGKEYGITRERVRQIESQAKKLLSRRHDVLEAVDALFREIFGEHGGVMAEDHLIEVVRERFPAAPKQSMITFYLHILPNYEFVTRSSVFGPHWSHPELHSKYADQVVEAAEKILDSEREPVKEDELIGRIRRDLSVDENELPNSCIYAMLVASKNLKKTVFGDWGLTKWVETSPRGVGDKAFIVLNRHGKPAHFREITSMINDVRFDHKQAHEQTVHNELIKDDRFVLVGRGLYGLTDWGFIPGTVADVLEAILHDAKEPLTRDELLERVLEQRMVKKTTVLLGLQNNKKFQRIGDGRYSLKT